jgi:predicted 3-demethylubiquinone-9 3-methyltransferase (glyoxalase superfamily)
MVRSVRPFLMFQDGQAAIDAYSALFADAVVRPMPSHRTGQAETETLRAILTIAGQEIMIYDSPVSHAFEFTPSFSLFVECAAEPKFDRLAAGLADGGAFLMPAADYGFSRKFAWLNDRFGVSWQVNLD